MSFQIIIQPPDTNANWTAFNRECEDLNSDFLMQPINEADYDSETQACVDMRSENGPKSFYEHYTTKRRKKKGMKGVGVEHPARRLESEGAEKQLRVTPTTAVGFGGVPVVVSSSTSAAAAAAAADTNGDDVHDGDDVSKENASLSAHDIGGNTSCGSRRSIAAHRAMRRKRLAAAAAAAASSSDVASSDHPDDDGDDDDGGDDTEEDEERDAMAQWKASEQQHDTMTAAASSAAAAEDVVVVGAASSRPAKFLDPTAGCCASSTSTLTHNAHNGNTNTTGSHGSNFLTVPTTTFRKHHHHQQHQHQQQGAATRFPKATAAAVMMGSGGSPATAAAAGCGATTLAVPTTTSAASSINQSSNKFHSADLLDVPNRITAAKGALNNAAIRRIACGRNPTPVWNAPTGFRSDGVNAHDSDGIAAATAAENGGTDAGIDAPLASTAAAPSLVASPPEMTCTITILEAGAASPVTFAGHRMPAEEDASGGAAERGDGETCPAVEAEADQVPKVESH